MIWPQARARIDASRSSERSTPTAVLQFRGAAVFSFGVVMTDIRSELSAAVSDAAGDGTTVEWTDFVNAIMRHAVTLFADGRLSRGDVPAIIHIAKSLFDTWVRKIDLPLVDGEDEERAEDLLWLGAEFALSKFLDRLLPA